MVPFGRVVEHDVENDFDPGSMQCFDHIAELVDRSHGILT
jgi:hypothetical protein